MELKRKVALVQKHIDFMLDPKEDSSQLSAALDAVAKYATEARAKLVAARSETVKVDAKAAVKAAAATAEIKPKA